MSIDSRLRDGLHRAMSTIDTDVDRHLNRAQRLGHRRVVVRRGVIAAGVVATIVVVALAAPAVLDLVRSHRHQPATPPSSVPITGSYVSTLTRQEATSIGDSRAAGVWVLRLRGDGILELASLKSAGLGGSSQYQLTGREILTTALGSPTCTGVGRYTWARGDSALVFEVVSDPCALRVAVLSAHPWKVK